MNDTPSQDNMPDDSKSDSNSSTTLLTGLGLAGAGLVVLFILLITVPICAIAILLLMGPTIGNVFSNVIEELEQTPAPSNSIWLTIEYLYYWFYSII
ncbi:hypothetical protein QUF63_06670 [Anaerolineales bacterium HSG25]|nr:hypothetical protein [Anaerolineales bacterium HSG25]